MELTDKKKGKRLTTQSTSGFPCGTSRPTSILGSQGIDKTPSITFAMLWKRTSTGHDRFVTVS